jgi:hypothetical protein
LASLSCGFEADGAHEGIEIIDNALIDVIKLRSPLGLMPCVCFDGAKLTGRPRQDCHRDARLPGLKKGGMRRLAEGSNPRASLCP